MFEINNTNNFNEVHKISHETNFFLGTIYLFLLQINVITNYIYYEVFQNKCHVFVIFNKIISCPNIFLIIVKILIIIIILSKHQINLPIFKLPPL